jgi:outer membrane lipoprotein-sorting protein
MSIAVPSTLRRWAVPSAAALAVIGGGVAVGFITKAADTARPPLSAQDLLVDLQTAHVDGLSGTVVARADLGLPPLPVPSAGSADLSSLASGTHTLKVWYANPKQARIALQGSGGETDVITNGTDLWTWSSAANTATHATLPAGGLMGMLGHGMLAGGLPGALGTSLPTALPTDMPTGLPTALPTDLIGAGGLNPDAVAKLVLSFLSSSTDVTTNNNASVAGRPAYELALTPKDTSSLIGSVVIDIDAEQHIPLRFAVLTRAGGTPAIEVAFSDISFSRPDPAQFTFNPPPGASVKDATIPPAPDAQATPRPKPTDHPDLTKPPVNAIGSFWTTVLVTKLPADALTDSTVAKTLALLPPVSGDWGSGHLLQTRLFSVLITDDGRLIVGAVGPDQLYAAAKG